ncbi:MAG: folate-binding protein YgfZ [Methylobacteriaceae bacterium]|nr:folate-binding protein YgfZ [Methylobacteriaceae bacterium]
MIDALSVSAPILLTDRGVLRVGGPQCEPFLQDLVSNDVTTLAASEARYAALLTPQGKILFDMIIIAIEEDGARGFLIDCARDQAADLAKRLGFYKLRAKVIIEDVSDRMAVLAYLDAAPQIDAIIVRDPRSELLGYRVYVAREHAPATQASIETYETRRVEAGVPRGGVDFEYGDAFPHEANLDQLNGIDFKKGCYVGQEVVSRMQHRGTARKRVVKVAFTGEAPPPGSEIKAGDALIGTMGSSAGGRGLALVRLDRLEEAKAAGVPFVACDASITSEG